MNATKHPKDFSINEIENIFAWQKEQERKRIEEKKKFDALPDLTFYFTIMSDDRELLEEGSEDPHQKYGVKGVGKTKELAEQNAVQSFKQQFGSDSQVYWVRCNGQVPSLNHMSVI